MGVSSSLGAIYLLCPLVPEKVATLPDGINIRWGLSGIGAAKISPNGTMLAFTVAKYDQKNHVNKISLWTFDINNMQFNEAASNETILTYMPDWATSLGIDRSISWLNSEQIIFGVRAVDKIVNEKQRTRNFYFFDVSTGTLQPLFDLNTYLSIPLTVIPIEDQGVVLFFELSPTYEYLLKEININTGIISNGINLRELSAFSDVPLLTVNNFVTPMAANHKVLVDEQILQFSLETLP